MAFYTSLFNPESRNGYIIVVLFIHFSRVPGFALVRTHREMSPLQVIFPDPLLWFWVRMQRWYHLCRFLNFRQEYISKFCLDGTWSENFSKFWWFGYLMLVSMPEFRQGYMGAWRQKNEQCIHIVGKDEILDNLIPPDANDELVLRRIRMFYRMIQMDSEIVGVGFPRLLERIDCIEVRAFILDSLSNRLPSPHETSRSIH